MLKIIGGSFSWVFWFSLTFFHLATEKEGKYKSFLKHSKSYPYISFQYYPSFRNQIEKSVIIVKVLTTNLKG